MPLKAGGRRGTVRGFWGYFGAFLAAAHSRETAKSIDSTKKFRLYFYFARLCIL